jgi:hypothetical protein
MLYYAEKLIVFNLFLLELGIFIYFYIHKPK